MPQGALLRGCEGSSVVPTPKIHRPRKDTAGLVVGTCWRCSERFYAGSGIGASSCGYVSVSLQAVTGRSRSYPGRAADNGHLALGDASNNIPTLDLAGRGTGTMET